MGPTAETKQRDAETKQRDAETKQRDAETPFGSLATRSNPIN